MKLYLDVELSLDMTRPPETPSRRPEEQPFSRNECCLWQIRFGYNENFQLWSDQNSLDRWSIREAIFWFHASRLLIPAISAARKKFKDLYVSKQTSLFSFKGTGTSAAGANDDFERFRQELPEMFEQEIAPIMRVLEHESSDGL